MTNANDNHDASWGSDPLEDEHMDDGIEGGFDDGFDGSMDGPASPAGPEQGRPEADKPCTCGQGEHCSCTPVARGGRGGRVAGPRSRPESRDILIFGPITPMMAREVTQHLLLLDQEDSTQPIRVLVNSPGGTSEGGGGRGGGIRVRNAPGVTVWVGPAAPA
ncbi:MAG: ATP-dependent Clp protease proteolytic subunit, partial [Planctomycetia bacterium]